MLARARTFCFFFTMEMNSPAKTIQKLHQENKCQYAHNMRTVSAHAIFSTFKKRFHKILAHPRNNKLNAGTRLIVCGCHTFNR